MKGVDASLLELFREEVRSHTGALTGGLLGLEKEPGDARRIEPLMRAAHSIKAAFLCSRSAMTEARRAGGHAHDGKASNPCPPSGLESTSSSRQRRTPLLPLRSAQSVPALHNQPQPSDNPEREPST